MRGHQDAEQAKMQAELIAARGSSGGRGRCIPMRPK